MRWVSNGAEGAVKAKLHELGLAMYVAKVKQGKEHPPEYVWRCFWPLAPDSTRLGLSRSLEGGKKDATRYARAFLVRQIEILDGDE